MNPNEQAKKQFESVIKADLNRWWAYRKIIKFAYIASYKIALPTVIRIKV